MCYVTDKYNMAIWHTHTQLPVTYHSFNINSSISKLALSFLHFHIHMHVCTYIYLFLFYQDGILLHSPGWYESHYGEDRSGWPLPLVSASGAASLKVSVTVFSWNLYLILFYIYECFVCTSVYVPHACWLLTEARGYWDPWKWSYRWFWAVMWFLGIEPGPQ